MHDASPSSRARMAPACDHDDAMAAAMVIARSRRRASAVKARLAELVAALRRGGVAVSVAEAIDGASALGVAGVERAVLRDALAATLVKHDEDRALYDEIFERLFPARVDAAPAPRRRRRSAEGGGVDDAVGAGRGTAGAGGRPARSGRVPPDDLEQTRPAPVRSAGETAAPRPRPQPSGEHDAAPEEEASSDGADDRATPTDDRPSGADGPTELALAADRRDAAGAVAERRARQLRQRALLAMPFRAMSACDVDQADALVRALARRFRGRLARRLQKQSRGRLDFRRTLRASIAHGGVPAALRFRGRRPRKLSLVAFCDLSASAAIATEFFLALLAPATDYFARVRLFGFVDRLVEIEFVAGQVRPAAPIDLMARSDFGRVLRDVTTHATDDLTADTVLLVLGDARNNRRPPRADLLGALRGRVRRVVWLDPEPVERWNTGDSVIAAYARHADTVVSCGSLAELDRAIATICAA